MIRCVAYGVSISEPTLYPETMKTANTKQYINPHLSNIHPLSHPLNTQHRSAISSTTLPLLPQLLPLPKKLKTKPQPQKWEDLERLSETSKSPNTSLNFPWPPSSTLSLEFTSSLSSSPALPLSNMSVLATKKSSRFTTNGSITLSRWLARSFSRKAGKA